MSITPVAQHINFKLVDERIIAPTVAARRLLAVTLLRIAVGFKLLSFRGVDTHLHLTMAESRSVCGEFVRRVKIGIVRALKLAVGFGPSHYEPVLDQRHLVNSFRYDLRQDVRHGCFIDPYHDASILPDLLGMRTNGGFVIPTVRSHLPRLTHEQLLSFLGPVDLSVPARSVELLGEAAAAAMGLAELRGEDGKRATAAAIKLASNLKNKELGRLLRISESTITRMRGADVDEALLRAVDLQLRFRSTLDANHSAGQPWPSVNVAPGENLAASAANQRRWKG